METTVVEKVVKAREQQREKARERRAEDRDLKRKSIQAVARELLKSLGSNFKIDEVARECRMSVGGIYIYFKSKDDLLVSLLEDLRVHSGAQSTQVGRLFMGNYFEVLLRAASCDRQELSAETDALLNELLPEFSETLKTELGDELIRRALRRQVQP